MVAGACNVDAAIAEARVFRSQAFVQKTYSRSAATKLHNYHRVYTATAYRPVPVKTSRLIPIVFPPRGTTEERMSRYIVRHKSLVAWTSVLILMVTVGAWVFAEQQGQATNGRLSAFLSFSAPAGNRPATTDTVIDGVRGAILPNGRLVTPAGNEINLQAPKPFGLALSPDGRRWRRSIAAPDRSR